MRHLQSRHTFNPVHEQWQLTACNLTGLQFVSRCDLDGVGPNVSVTHPCIVRYKLGDGNYLFRLLIPGKLSTYKYVRLFSTTWQGWMIGHHISGEYPSIADHIRGTSMERNGTWGTDIELLTASHMFNP